MIYILQYIVHFVIHELYYYLIIYTNTIAKVQYILSD